MRKLAFCICENKDTDRLRGDREADQCLCFRYTDSFFFFLQFNVPFKIISLIETSQSVGGAIQEYPGKTT